MSHRPYPDAERALRQLERHVPGSLRDPHAYEPQIYRVAEREQPTPTTMRISPEVRDWYDGIGVHAVAAAQRLCEASRQTRRPR